MSLRVLVVVVMLLTAAGLGFVAWEAVDTDPAPIPEASQVAPARMARLLVATRPLPAGTLLKDDDLAVSEVPATSAPAEALTDDAQTRGEARGAMLRRYIDNGSAVLKGDLLRPRDRGFLAAVLRDGFMAIGIGVDAVTGAGGLVWPGDVVDLIVTQQLDAGDVPPSRRVSGNTVVAGVRVVAVDQEITQGASGSGTGEARRVARTVTLEVTAPQAQRIAVADRVGRLSLVIRSMGAGTGASKEATPQRPVFGGDVAPGLVPDTSTTIGSKVRVIQGSESKEVTFR